MIETVIAHDIDELARVLDKYEQEIYVCGGEQIYRQLLPYCNRALIQIDEVFRQMHICPTLTTHRDGVKHTLANGRKVHPGLDSDM